MNNQQIFKQVQIIFYAIMTGHILFACIIVFAIKPMRNDSLNTDVVLGVIVAVSAINILLGFGLYAQQLKKIVSLQETPEDRLIAWRTPFIIRIAMIEAICMLNLVMLLVTGNSIFLYIYIAAAAVMMYTKPQPYKIAEELSLEKLW
jgi:hypothetical protein